MTKWRLTYEGCQRFIDTYLQRFSTRENADIFNKRKNLTYNPAFAKQAVEEVKNSIFQRIIDVNRNGGSQEYQDAIAGIDGGIDMLGSSMPSFIGNKILPELLSMSRVGVFVDMPEVNGQSLISTIGKKPYIYSYCAEDIRSWTIDDSNTDHVFTNVLLRDWIYEYDENTGLPLGQSCRYRHMWLNNGKVNVQFYDQDPRGGDYTAQEPVIVLNITKIPFMIVKISDSLLADVANYQIALLNLASSDVAYTLSANFPFYTEQTDPRSDTSAFIRKAGNPNGGESVDANASKVEEVRVGIVTGRRYGRGLERPGFIHPSSEPLKASMEKQEQLKVEIRQLVNLAVSNLQPQTNTSADSKKLDNQGLESGLSYIGLELERMERNIAVFWSMYENNQPATIFYPESYSLKTEDERRKEAKDYIEILPAIPSPKGQKEIIKHVTELLLLRKVKGEELNKILAEIDAAKGTTSDSKIINADVVGGFLDLETAAVLRGYPKEVVEKAIKDHADRLKRITESQTPKNDLVNGAARGNPDLADTQDGGAKEKQSAKDTTKDPVPQDKTRGEGKGK